MKKLLFTAAAVFAFGFANAQDGEMTYGVKAGYAAMSAKMESDGMSASGSDGGFFVGGFLDMPLSGSLSFKPEVLYVSIPDLSQIQLPLHVKYNVGETFGIIAGPNLAFITGAPEGIKSFNYGIDLGAAYNITENLVVDARYNLGLANLWDVEGDDDTTYKLSGFYVGIGYKF